MAGALIFDVDGTLVTFKFEVQATRKAIIDTLEARGFDTSGLGLSTPTQQILDDAQAQVIAGKVTGDFSSLRSEVYALLDDFEVVSASKAEAFPGTREVLRTLRSMGYRLAVLTNSGKKAADEALRKAGLSDCFELILTRDETETMKPKPDGLVKAASMLRASVDDSIYVGDSPFDITAARGAGMKVVSVATGNYSRDKLKEAGADFVLDSIQELPGLLGAGV